MNIYMDERRSAEGDFNFSDFYSFQSTMFEGWKV